MTARQFVDRIIRIFTLYFLIVSTLSLWVIFFTAVGNGSHLTILTNYRGEEPFEIAFGIVGLCAMFLFAVPVVIRDSLAILEKRD